MATAYEVSFFWGVLVSVVSFLTAYYIFREGFVMFHGKEHFRHEHKEEPHESPGVMTIPMVVLGVMAVSAGFFEGGMVVYWE